MQDGQDVRDVTELAVLPRDFVRRREAFLVAATVLAGAEFLKPIATWPSHLINFAFYLYKLGWLAVIGLGCAALVSMYRWAKAAGGANYAAGYLLLSIGLTPVLGFMLVPALVQRDIERGHAEWRRRTAPDTGERVLRTVLYFACLAVVVLVLSPLEREFLLAAPVLAFLLQRLVLPWCRRAEPDGNGVA